MLAKNFFHPNILSISYLDLVPIEEQIPSVTIVVVPRNSNYLGAS